MHIASFIIRKKILNYFGCVEVRILVEKWNIHEAHIFQSSLVQLRWLETTSLCLNTRLNVIKKFSNYHYIYWNLGNRLSFMCSPPNDKCNLSYSRTQHSRKRQLRTWFLCFSWCSFFAFWAAEKQLFHISPFRSKSYVLKSFVCFDVSNRVSNWYKGKHLIFVGSIIQICQL
jgi:hypothetical protein